MQVACSDLHPCNPIRLGLTLNLAVFLKEVKNQTSQAILVAQSALQNAVDKIDDEGEQGYADTKRLMDVLATNLHHWKGELVAEGLDKDEGHHFLKQRKETIALGEVF